LFLLSCGNDGITLMVYNVENLFDDVDNGTEYKEFDPGTGKWTRELFLSRVDTVAEVIRRAVPGGPDIIVLQEIENENALKTLQERGLRGLGYTRAVLVPAKGAATNPAVLTRLPVSRVHSIQTTERDAYGARHVLGIEILVGGSTLQLFNNHWKSKTGGERETEGSRVRAAAAVSAKVKEILAADPAADVIVAGDMNESSDEFSRVSGKYRTALLPFSPDVPREYDDGIFLTPSAAEAGVRDGRLVLFDTWSETAEKDRGSFSYGGQWHTVDHILMSPGLFDRVGFFYQKGSYRVYRESFLLLPDGRPRKWEDSKEGKGYSDHLPLLIRLDTDAAAGG
jgi:endonuclease/exonuclease/phosphatase family metal-dependent hydrolase